MKRRATESAGGPRTALPDGGAARGCATPSRSIATSLLASVVAHGAMAGVAAWLLTSEPTIRRYELPVELVAPEPSRPPQPPQEQPPAPKLPDPPPTPEPEKSAAVPAQKEAAPKQPEATKAPQPKALDQEAQAPAKPPRKSALEKQQDLQNRRAAATPVKVPDKQDKKTDAKKDAPPLPAPSVTAKAAFDLAPFTPGGAKLRVVVRIDRMRNTKWLTGMEAVLGPMPDYQSVIAGTKLSLGEAFDLLMISTPNPQDVEATFLAAKTARDEDTLRTALAGAGDPPRVTWELVAGGVVGHRAIDSRYADDDQDPRVYLLPYAGWMLLTRPEHVEKLLAPAELPEVTTDGDAGVTATLPDPPPMPRWLERLSNVVGETGTGDGPVIVLGFSDLGEKTITLPGLAELPAPQRGFVSLSLTAHGVLASGWMFFKDVATAKAFAAEAEKARAEAIDSMAIRFLLDRVHARSAVQQLRFEQVGANVAFSTRIPDEDGLLIIDAAASWSKDWFEGRRRQPKGKKTTKSP